MSLRVALFVEGSESPPPPRGLRALERIWNEDLPQALEIDYFEQVFPISKKHLVAMDPEKPQMSGSSEGLDQLMVRKLSTHPFDAAVVAWDLIPAWNPEEDSYCRWEETLRFYELLSLSDSLAEPWKSQAFHRHQELSNRPVPKARKRPPQIQEHSILALCMVPMFEELLVLDESAAKRALGIASRRLPSTWPSNWGAGKSKHPDDLLLHAVNTIRSLSPPLRVVKQVRGDMRNNKDGWGEFLLRKMLEDEQVSDVILQHPIAARLKELRGG